MSARILIISPINPNNWSTGESERIEYLFKSLNVDEFESDLIHGDGKNSGDPMSFPTFISRYFYDMNPVLYYKVYKLLSKNEYQAIQVEGPRGVIAAKLVSKFFNSRPEIILDAHNFEAGDADRERSKDINLIKRILAPHVILLFEWLSVNIADHILTVSERDKENFQEEYNVSKNHLTVIPSGSEEVDSRKLTECSIIREKYDLPSDKTLAVFHGTYSYEPNEEAVTEIRTKIAPKLLDEQIDFVIAGSGVPEFSEKNVHGVGFVDDLYSFLNACDVAVVPLQTGGGTKLKMFDYMACGIPVVTSPEGAEGIDLDHQKHVLIAKDTKEFINGVQTLLKNPSKKRLLADQSRNLFKKKYTWKAIGKRIREFYSNY
jgi:glycosyltransferase involved in cell wall biosynthesis